MRNTPFTLTIAAGLFLAASIAVYAQQSNAPATPTIRPMTPSGANPPVNRPVSGPLGVLDEQQRASYMRLMDDLRPKIAEQEAKLRTARQELMEVTVAEKFNEAAVREKAMAAAKIEAEMTVMRVKAFSEIQPPLTAEQIQKIKSGQSGTVHPLPHPESERPLAHPAPGSTNQDANGLPPKH